MDKPVWGGQVTHCWTAGGIEYGPNSLPLACGKWHCRDCGKRKGKTLIRELITAWLAVYGPETPARLMTLTLRAPVAVLERGGVEWGKVSRRVLQETGRTEEELNRMSAERREWTPEEMDKWLTKCMQKLAKRWHRDLGERPEFLRTTELTKQGTPHIHLVLPDRPYLLEQSFFSWLRRTWLEITGDSHIVHISDRDGLHRGAKVETLHKCLRYVLKYVTKAFKEEGKEWQYPHRRRYNCTAGFPRCIVRTEEFVKTTGGEFLEQWSWRRATGMKGYLKSKLNKAIEAGRGIEDAQLDYLEWAGKWTTEKRRRDDRKIYIPQYRHDWRPEMQERGLHPHGGHHYYAQLRTGEWIASY